MKKLPRILMITDGKGCDETVLKKIEIACSIAPHLVGLQMREKQLDDKAAYLLAKQLRELTTAFGVPFWINDRMDIAIASQADGVHLPENGLPLSELKRMNKKLIIGVSVHSLKAAEKAVREGADYLIVGTIYETKGKIPKGTSLIKLTAKLDVPIYAIGGMTPERVQECLKSGAYGIAAMSRIFSQANLAGTIEDFRRCFEVSKS